MKKQQKETGSLLMAVVGAIIPMPMPKKTKMTGDRICGNCQRKIPNGYPVCRHCHNFRSGNKQLVLPRRDQIKW